MRIVEVIPSMAQEASGPTYSVSMLGQSLAASGFDVEIFSLGGDELPLGDKVVQKRFAKDFGQFPLVRDLCFSSGMRAGLRKSLAQADVVHSHGLWLMPTVYPGWEARRANKPLIVSPRGTLSPLALDRSALKKRTFWMLFQERVLRTAKILHATSEAEFADIRAAGLSQPVAVIPNGIDIPSAPPASPRPRQILYLGRLHPIKGLDILLAAWRSVAQRFPDWDLRIAGPDEDGYQAQLEGLVATWGLERVHFAGPYYGKHKVAEYQGAALYVLPSHTENFGMTVAEALASGTPVITTEGTPWSGLQTRECGWWIKLGVESLAAALAEAMSLPDAERQRMGARGRQWMADDFSWEQVANEMAQVYRWAAGSGPMPSSIQLD